MCTVFWDRTGMILLDFMEPEQIMSTDCYITMLTNLKAQTFSCNMLIPGPTPFWRHIADLICNFPPHPLCILDFMPFDFHLFRLLKDGLCGYFPSYSAIIAAVKLGHLHWCIVHSIQSFFHCWQKCTSNSGDHFEKLCFVPENLLYQGVIVFFASIVVSMEMNRMYYLQSNLCT